MARRAPLLGRVQGDVVAGLVVTGAARLRIESLEEAALARAGTPHGT